MQEATITEISLDQLHESPFNPRKRFTGIEELAATITAEGRIHQPLLVRNRMVNLTAPNPDDMFDGYEIVFGHRRYRAAELAGLATVPCMVRAMSDAEARSAQTVENLQRVDVHPIEEAEGFATLMREDGLSADELAETFGKSRSYIYGRLKLLQACPVVREACLAGDIGSEVALLIARLRTDKLQEKALQHIKGRNQDIKDGGKESFRRIRGILAEHFNTALKTALFDREDVTLLEAAGACSACPKRAGNAPEFADIAESTDHSHWQKDLYGADICTDPDCWDAKKKAHLVREAGKLEAAGKVVVGGNKARAALASDGKTVRGAYIALDKVKAALKKLPKKGSPAALDVAAPVVVHIQDQRTGKVVQAVARADLVAAGVLKPEEAKPKAAEKKAPFDYEAQARENKLLDAKAKAESARRLALLQAVRQEIGARPRDAFDLRLVASAALAGVGYHDRPLIAQLHGAKNDEALKRAIDTMPVGQLTLLLMDCVLVDNVRVDRWQLDTKPGPLLALANHYGVDVKAVREEASGPARDTATGDLLQDVNVDEEEGAEA